MRARERPDNLEGRLLHNRIETRRGRVAAGCQSARVQDLQSTIERLIEELGHAQQQFKSARRETAELRGEQLREAVLVRCRTAQVEPPGRPEPIIGAAKALFEKPFSEQTMLRLGRRARSGWPHWSSWAMAGAVFWRS
ncbi:hypothetical protein [Kribbella sp. CA-294648]|uniref:hypothetical protein n=1 Tax=Kribbella sp. CA-294648 TaxID=3239948 RepID=UPI003D934D5D